MQQPMSHKVFIAGETVAGVLAGSAVGIWLGESISKVLGGAVAWSNEYYHLVAVVAGILSISWYVRQHTKSQIAKWRHYLAMKRKLKRANHLTKDKK